MKVPKKEPVDDFPSMPPGNEISNGSDKFLKQPKEEPIVLFHPYSLENEQRDIRCKKEEPPEEETPSHFDVNAFGNFPYDCSQSSPHSMDNTPSPRKVIAKNGKKGRNKVAQIPKVLPKAVDVKRTTSSRIVNRPQKYEEYLLDPLVKKSRSKTEKRGRIGVSDTPKGRSKVLSEAVEVKNKRKQGKPVSNPLEHNNVDSLDDSDKAVELQSPKQIAKKCSEDTEGLDAPVRPTTPHGDPEALDPINEHTGDASFASDKQSSIVTLLERSSPFPRPTMHPVKQNISSAVEGEQLMHIQKSAEINEDPNEIAAYEATIAEPLVRIEESDAVNDDPKDETSGEPVDHLSGIADIQYPSTGTSSLHNHSSAMGIDPPSLSENSSKTKCADSSKVLTCFLCHKVLDPPYRKFPTFPVLKKNFLKKIVIPDADADRIAELTKSSICAYFCLDHDVVDNKVSKQVPSRVLTPINGDVQESIEEEVKNTLKIGETTIHKEIPSFDFMEGDINFHEDGDMNDDMMTVNGLDDSTKNDQMEKEEEDEGTGDTTTDSSKAAETDKRKRPQRSISKAVKYSEPMNESDEDDAPSAKKIELNSENNSFKRRNSSTHVISQSESDMERDEDSNNVSDMECPECEFRSRSVSGLMKHLRNKHSTTPTLAGLAFLCACGNESFSAKHSSKCNISNFTVIRKTNGPIQRICDPKTPTTPKCVLCDVHPTTISGYLQHLEIHHNSTLKANGIYLKCACGCKVGCYSKFFKEHFKQCEVRQFTRHNLADEEKTTPQCVLCDIYPSTISGYISHLRKHHKSTLRSNGLFMKCSCDFECRSDSISVMDHGKRCDSQEFNVHKLDDVESEDDIEEEPKTKRFWGVAKTNDTDLECSWCEFRTRSAKSWLSHLRNKHSTTPTLTTPKCPLCDVFPSTISGYLQHLEIHHNSTLIANGIYLKCACGNKVGSYTKLLKKHFKQCEVRQFTLHNLAEEEKTTPQCVLCDKHPSSIYGYIRHLYAHHKSSLKSNSLFLKCSCGFEARSDSISVTDHGKRCNREIFTLHKLDEE